MSLPRSRDIPDAADPESLDPEALRAFLAACVKRYVRLIEEGHDIPPFPSASEVNATEVVATVSAMLEQVDIEVFELGMWQSWGRL